MNLKRKQKGVTLVEIMIVVVALFTVVVVGFGVIFCGICGGNYWFNEENALRTIQRVDPNQVEIDLVDRNIWAHSRITTKDTSGTLTTWKLDTNIMQDREATLLADDK
jgi:hypothetical protein